MLKTQTLVYKNIKSNVVAIANPIGMMITCYHLSNHEAVLEVVEWNSVVALVDLTEPVEKSDSLQPENSFKPEWIAKRQQF